MQEKLNQFCELLREKKCKFWSNSDELGKEVFIGLSDLQQKHPAPGYLKLPYTTDDIMDVLEADITHVYSQRRDALGDIEKDIQNAKKSVDMVARVYISELIKGGKLAQAIFEAVTRTKNSEDFIVQHVFTDPGNRSLADKVYNLEDPSKSHWKNLNIYLEHLNKDSPVAFWGQCDRVAELIRENCKDIGRKIIFKLGYIKEHVLPYSMCVIDDKVLYVTFYTLAGASGDQWGTWGTYSPTVRLESVQQHGRSWVDLFLREKRAIFNTKSNKYIRIVEEKTIPKS